MSATQHLGPGDGSIKEATTPNGAKEDTYSSIEKGTYALKRDFTASTRLTAQHYLYKEAVGYNLNPKIPINPTHTQIADVATGNGIWLLDVSRKFPPTVQFIGFDISLDQCSPAAWLPENINLHTWDIYEPPPEEFVEAFDVVHIRLITVAVRDNDPRPIMKNLRQLLKPNGYLQWDEADNINWEIKTIHPSIRTDALRTLFQQLCGTHDWKSNMITLLNDNGFQDAFLHRAAYDPSLWRVGHELNMGVWDEFAKVVLRTPEESYELSERAMEEVREGAAIWCPILVWVAQKTA